MAKTQYQVVQTSTGRFRIQAADEVGTFWVGGPASRKFCFDNQGAAENAADQLAAQEGRIESAAQDAAQKARTENLFQPPKALVTRKDVAAKARALIQTQRTEVVNEQVLTKALAKGSRWMGAAYGEVDWAEWVAESGLDGVANAIAFYYKETLEDPTGLNTRNNQVAAARRRCKS